MKEKSEDFSFSTKVINSDPIIWIEGRRDWERIHEQYPAEEHRSQLAEQAHEPGLSVAFGFTQHQLH